MNTRCADFILTIFTIFTLFAIISSSHANEIKFKKRSVLQNARNKLYRFQTPRYKFYYDLLNKPRPIKPYFKIFKKKLQDTEPFEDLTRFDEDDSSQIRGKYRFSEDYIDISELARYYKRPYYDFDQELLLQLNPWVRRLVGNRILKRARRMMPFQKRSNFKSELEHSDSSSESKSEESNSEDLTKKNPQKTNIRHVPNRFQVVNNVPESISDDDEIVDVNSSDDDKKTHVGNDSETVENDSESGSEEKKVGDYVIQSPMRFINADVVEWRRRLKHFLPKRVHWDLREFQRLSNYWNAGPRGRYPEQYKTPY